MKGLNVMKKLSKRIFTLAMVAVLLLTSVFSAGAKTTVNNSVMGISISFPDEWLVAGVDEETDRKIFENLNDVSEEDFEGIMELFAELNFAMLNTGEAFFMAGAGEEDEYDDFSSYTQEELASIAEIEGKSFAGDAEFTKELYFANNIPYLIFTSIDTSDDEVYCFIAALTVVDGKEYAYTIMLKNEQLLPDMVDDMKTILDSVVYGVEFPEPEPTIFTAEEIGLEVEMGADWIGTGMDVDENSFLLDYYELSEEEFEQFMTENKWYLYLLNPEKKSQLNIYAFGYEGIEDMKDYSDEELKALVEETAEEISVSLSETEGYGNSKILYSDYYRNDNNAYMIFCYSYEYDDQTIYETYITTVINQVVYRYYYYEYDEDDNYAINGSVEKVVKRVEGILDGMEYTEVENAPAPLDYSDEPTRMLISLADDIYALQQLSPYFEGYTSNYFENFGILLLALGAVVVVGGIVGGITAIIFAIGKARRRRA